MLSFGISIHSLIWKGNRFLITKRPSNANFGANHWDCPGGALELGEDPEDGLLREIQEETGIVVRIGKPISIFSKIVPEKNKQIVYIILSAEYINGDVDLNNEHVEYRWVELEEALELVLVDYLKKTLTEMAITNQCISTGSRV